MMINHALLSRDLSHIMINSAARLLIIYITSVFILLILLLINCINSNLECGFSCLILCKQRVKTFVLGADRQLVLRFEWC